MLILIQKILSGEEEVSRNVCFWSNGLLFSDDDDSKKENDQDTEQSETCEESQVT